MWISPSNLLYIIDRISNVHGDTMQLLYNYNYENQNIDTHIISSSFFKNYMAYGHSARDALIVKNSNATLSYLNVPAKEEIVVECKQNYSLNTLRQMQNVNLDSDKVPHVLDSLNVLKYSIEKYVELNANRAELIQTKINDDCSICLDKPKNLVLTRCCTNSFCGGCSIRHLLTSSTCPTCRAQQGSEDLVHIPEGTNELYLGPLMNRQQACIDYINRHSNESIVVYTSFENTYYQLLPELQKIHINADRLEMATHSNIIKQFNNGLIKVLFVSNVDVLKGLNLTKASHLIFFYELPFYDQKKILFSSMERMKRTTPLKVLHLKSQEL